MTSTQIWVAWKLSLNSPVFGAAIWECFVGLFKKKRTQHNQLFTVTLWSAVRAVGVLFVLILEFSIRNMFHFLDDVHIVEVLNLWTILVQKEVYQKWNIAHRSQILIQVSDHIVLG
jgi:hypothetical protein